MFSRRRTQPLPSNQPPSTSAAAAAAQAFLSHHSSNVSLSSAAAAAALRSHTASPVSVADVQTRRTIRRHASNSSLGSSGARPSLQRRTSSGSMTERTFRSPSPHNGEPRRSTETLPPVPPIPKKARQRAASLEPIPRVMSPPPTQPGGRGVSLDRGPQPMPPSRIAARKASGLASVQEIERSDSRASVNYSRPMPASPIETGRVASPPPRDSLDSLNPLDISRIQKNVAAVADQPVKKKKKKKKKQVAHTEPIAPSDTNGHALVAATEAASLLAPPAPALKKTKKKKVAQATEGPTDEQRPTSPSAGSGTPLKKRPSTVREVSEEEDSADDRPQHQVREDALRQLENGDDEEAAEAVGKAKAEPNAVTPSVADPHKLASQTGSARGNRPASLSPSRQAHFSKSPTLVSPDILKHEPPPRALSPAKSAMKHSSSRDGSPAGYLSHGKTPSEASDSATMLSDDGALSAIKRRKHVRVSFEEGSVVLGQAASPPTTPDTPVILSPQHKDPAKRPWYSGGRSKNKGGSSVTDEEDDLEGMMQSRPALPSFGSVRSRKTDETVDRSPEPASDSNTSSDRAIGSLISRDVHAKITDDDPAPPIVTSVEGTGYDSGSDYSSQVDSLAPQGQQQTTGNKEHNGNIGAPRDVPQIALTQPTPTLEQPEAFITTATGKITFDEIVDHVPTDPTPAAAGIAEPEPAESAANHEPSTPSVGHFAEDLKPQIVSSEGEEETDFSEDSSEVYSDAAEDLSDLEGDGFGSINAIVESPVVESFSAAAKATPPESPSAGASFKSVQKGTKRTSGGKVRSDPNQPSPDAGWTKTQEYWNNLSADRKKEMESAAVTKPKGEPNKPKQKKTVEEEAPPVKPRNPARLQTQQDKPLRKTMRSSPVETVPPPTGPKKRAPKKTGGLRTSMRTQAEDPVPTIRAPKVRTQQPRPLSVPVEMPLSARTSRHLRNMSATSAASSQSTSKPPARQGLGRSLAQDSDSDASASSFKKARKQNRGGGGGFGRKTMRGPPPSAASQRPTSPDSVASNSRRPFSLRSLSPAGSNSGFRRPFSSSGVPAQPPIPGTLRTSMRGSEGTSNPTLRSSMERPSSSGLFSKLGRSRDKKDKKAAPRRQNSAVPAARSKTSSRFADSSDDDDGDIDAAPARSFHSRFGDSSDEEDKASLNLPPVRGIPRRSGDTGRESTDLDDSSVDEASPQTPKAKALIPSTSTPSTLAPSSPITPQSTTPQPSKKRRNLFSTLSRRKDKTSKISKPLSESAARLDTPLERTPLALAASRLPATQDPLPSSSPLTPRSPSSPLQTQPAKLAKRASASTVPTMRAASSDAWPLPPLLLPVDSNLDRPSTADAAKTGKRSSFFGGQRPGLSGFRRATTGDELAPKEADVPPVPALPGKGVGSPLASSTGAGSGSVGASSEGLGEKKKGKKFPLLRRVLRLDY
ncbi:MAG: hypothetical protein M1814_001960 [Vezdaea aestivalis]|nr:MAG: hypothetical protein M1814_001960 [Vezdaea aestivalis]